MKYEVTARLVVESASEHAARAWAALALENLRGSDVNAALYGSNISEASVSDVSEIIPPTRQCLVTLVVTYRHTDLHPENWDWTKLKSDFELADDESVAFSASADILPDSVIEKDRAQGLASPKPATAATSTQTIYVTTASSGHRQEKNWWTTLDAARAAFQRSAVNNPDSDVVLYEVQVMAALTGVQIDQCLPNLKLMKLLSQCLGRTQPTQPKDHW